MIRELDLSGFKILMPDGKELDVTKPLENNPNKDLTDEEKHLLARYGDAKAFGYAISMPSRRFTYMKQVWHKVNNSNSACGGKMTEPKFALLKNQPLTKFRLRGRWSPGSRTLALSPHCFDAHEAVALTTLVHEIAHQAVTEFEGIPVERTKKGHGPLWEKWMRNLGFTNPSRYCHYDNEEYVDEKTRQVKNEPLGGVSERVKGLPGEYVQFLDIKTKRWVVGSLLPNVRYKKNPHYFGVLIGINPWSIVWKKTGVTALCKLPDEFATKLKEPNWIKMVQQLNSGEIKISGSL